MDTLILGLGNDFCGDDGIGIAIAENIKADVNDCADVIISNESGLAIIDYLLGYKKAIIIDAIHTGKYQPGTVIELTVDDLRQVGNPSPHYTGLPEIKKLSHELNLVFPNEIRIFAVEIPDTYEISEKLSQPVSRAIDDVAGGIKALLAEWNHSDKAGDIKLNVLS
jgi:hydrogenase maturation protease